MGLVALGVCGGIGAYKAVEIVRGLQEEGHTVVAILTRAARRFVGELTFEAITRRRVITDQFALGSNADIEHISLASDIDALLIAPATANMVGKLANGIADDFLTTLYLATRAPAGRSSRATRRSARDATRSVPASERRDRISSASPTSIRARS